LKHKILIGIDEAGRGPLLGPMVLALVAIEEPDTEKLAALGVRDSKELSRESREKLQKAILGIGKYIMLLVIPPSIIDEYNLNNLEYESIAYMLERAHKILRYYEESEWNIFIDAVGPTSKLRSYLLSRLPWLRSARLVVEPKADSKYIAVSAASILAKVVRDAEIEKLRKLYGVKGSGYPTDPATLSWIREEYRRNPQNPPPFIRRTWSTLKHLAPAWYREKKTSKTSEQRTLLDYLYPKKPK